MGQGEVRSLRAYNVLGDSDKETAKIGEGGSALAEQEGSGGSKVKDLDGGVRLETAVNNPKTFHSKHVLGGERERLGLKK